MSESMDTMIFHEDIIIETVSSTKRIEQRATFHLQSSKQTKDITTKKGRKRRNTDISDGISAEIGKIRPVLPQNLV